MRHKANHASRNFRNGKLALDTILVHHEVKFVYQPGPSSRSRASLFSPNDLISGIKMITQDLSALKLPRPQNDNVRITVLGTVEFSGWGTPKGGVSDIMYYAVKSHVQGDSLSAGFGSLLAAKTSRC